jgi:serine/threonine protein phosphatase 1
MRTLVIGDIHGHYDTLDRLLQYVQLTAEDRLITLGDYIDRGKQSRQVLDRLIPLYEAGQLVALRGNHEEMMFEARTNNAERRMWLRHGGTQTVQSYGHEPHDESFRNIPERHYRFIGEETRLWYETESHIFAHAIIDPVVEMQNQSRERLLWGNLHETIKHKSGKTFVCGHTRQDDGLPVEWPVGSSNPWTICIDTSVYTYSGWLTCMEAATRYYWQVNRLGARRQGTLMELCAQMTD